MLEQYTSASTLDQADWLVASRTLYPEVPVRMNTSGFYIEGQSTATGTIRPTHRDTNAAAKLQALADAGVTVCWYVPTSNDTHHTDMSNPPFVEEVYDVLDAIKLYYPEIAGIFFDEVYSINMRHWVDDENSELLPDEIAYELITNYAASKGFIFDINGAPPAPNGTNPAPFRFMMREMFVLAAPTGTGTFPTAGSDWRLPTAAEVDAAFPSYVPVDKRLVDMYISAEFFPSPQNLTETVLTRSMVEQYVGVAGCFMFISQWRTSFQGEHNQLSQILEDINTSSSTLYFSVQPSVSASSDGGTIFYATREFGVLANQLAQSETLAGALQFVGMASVYQLKQAETLGGSLSFASSVIHTQAKQTQSIASLLSFTFNSNSNQAKQTEAINSLLSFISTSNENQAKQTESAISTLSFDSNLIETQQKQNEVTQVALSFGGSVVETQAKQTLTIQGLIDELLTEFFGVVNQSQSVQQVVSAASLAFSGIEEGTQRRQTEKLLDFVATLVKNAPSIYAKKIAEVKRKIAAKGVSVTWRKKTEADTETPWRKSATVEEFPVSMLFLPTSKIGGESESNGDKAAEVKDGLLSEKVRGLMGAVDFKPSIFDTIKTADDSILTVLDFDVLAPDGNAIIYEVVFSK